jgi:hypothetical protein
MFRLKIKIFVAGVYDCSKIVWVLNLWLIAVNCSVIQVLDNLKVDTILFLFKFRSLILLDFYFLLFLTLELQIEWFWINFHDFIVWHWLRS